MTANVDTGVRDTRSPATGRRSLGALLRLRAQRLARLFSQRAASSLVRRIVVLNLAGLVALLGGFLYLNQFRAGLIDARVQSLLTQGEIIAGAVAASATVDTDQITIDPDKLLQLQAGESLGPGEDGGIEFSINPERVAPLLRRLVMPTRTRARIYDRDGFLMIDSRAYSGRPDIISRPLPPPEDDDNTLIERTWSQMKRSFGRTGLPLNDDASTTTDGKTLPEVSRALGGSPASVVRVNSAGETIVSVAVPIQRFRAVRGALLLSTQGGDIDGIIASERMAILRVFGVAAGIMIVLSVLFAGTIAGPIRRLSAAADRVRRDIKAREEIPDFTARSDEIGHLSGSLREMTQALYDRIEAIESFAADVAHELKNPLTSLRSAVETLPLARSDESRGRLLSVIQHDVRRLDRLISDISDASRLDAELVRADARPVDMALLLQTVTGVANEVRRDDGVSIRLDIAPSPMGRAAFRVMGHDSRLGQVISNLVENARSFSPKGGEVRVGLRRIGDEVEIRVEDDGPGIPAHAFERIFERFYTDRPEDQGFGQNSGLGLSISRQIVVAHHGRIWAENRQGPDGSVAGALFFVRLPAAPR
ncbi:stimulus-sensing domain-containing protein [Alsobacter sp. R-9]